MLRMKTWLAVGAIAVFCISCANAGSLVIKRGQIRIKGQHAPIHTKALLPLPFNDTCERSFPGSWAPYDANSASTGLPTNPYFGPTTYRHYGTTGTRSYYCSQAGPHRVAAPGPYPTSFQGWITYGPFSLADATAGRVRFKLWNSAGTGDEVFAGWSLDDNTYEGVSWTGTSDGWVAATADMSGYDTTYLGNANVYFSFYFYSDSSSTGEGAYIDNISITKDTAVPRRGGLTGTVKDGSGAALKGAVVTAGSDFVYTDAQGKYSLSLASGTYAVKVQKPGYAFSPAAFNLTVGTTMVTRNMTGTPRTGDGAVRYWAVNVGIASYQYVNNLSYCDDDARDMTAALKAAGYATTRIRQLIDSQATKQAIKNAIAWMAANADADDVCVFFQSSHGDTGPDVAPLDEGSDNTDEYLCTYDTNGSHTSEIRDDELGQWMAALKTTKYVVFIDTCFAGGMIKSSGFGSGFARALNGMSAPGTVGDVRTKDLDDLGSGVVVTSCTDTEESAETSALQNGVFAYYLVQGMTNRRADANGDGYYSAEEIYNYCKTPVHTANPGQTLCIYDGYPGQLKFARSTTAAGAPSAALVLSGTAAVAAGGTSVITVNLSAAASVSATICNLAGRPIAALAPQDLGAGVSTLLWNGKSALGTKVPAGMYLVKLQAADAYGNLANCLTSLRK